MSVPLDLLCAHHIHLCKWKVKAELQFFRNQFWNWTIMLFFSVIAADSLPIPFLVHGMFCWWLETVCIVCIYKQCQKVIPLFLFFNHLKATQKYFFWCLQFIIMSCKIKKWQSTLQQLRHRALKQGRHKIQVCHVHLFRGLCDIWFYLQSWYLTKSIIFSSRRHLSFLSLILGFPLSICRIQLGLIEYKDIIFFIQKLQFCIVLLSISFYYFTAHAYNMKRL